MNIFRITSKNGGGGINILTNFFHHYVVSGQASSANFYSLYILWDKINDGGLRKQDFLKRMQNRWIMPTETSHQWHYFWILFFWYFKEFLKLMLIVVNFVKIRVKKNEWINSSILTRFFVIHIGLVFTITYVFANKTNLIE